MKSCKQKGMRYVAGSHQYFVADLDAHSTKSMMNDVPLTLFRRAAIVDA